jgi:hypothetical protein
MIQETPLYQLVVRPTEIPYGPYSWARVRATRKAVQEYRSRDRAVSSWTAFSATTESSVGRSSSPMRSFVGLLIIEHPPQVSYQHAARVSFMNWQNIPMPQSSPLVIRLLELLQVPVRESLQYGSVLLSDGLLVEPTAWSYQPSILQLAFEALTPSLAWCETSGSWWSQLVFGGNLLSGSS